MLAIETRALRKEYSADVEAVAGIDLDVNEGEVFGFLGPNGAGKTTTVRMLTTLLAPTSGEARVMGFDLYKSKHEIRRSIGVALQEAGLDPLSTGRELLVLQGQLNGLRAANRSGAPKSSSSIVGLDGRGGPASQDVLRRHEAPAGPRQRADPRAAHAVPRRADRRSRPGQPRLGLGRGAAPEQTGHDGVLDYALPGRGGPPRQPVGDHRPRAHRRRGHAHGAQGGYRIRRRHGFLQLRPRRGRPAQLLPRWRECRRPETRATA